MAEKTGGNGARSWVGSLRQATCPSWASVPPAKEVVGLNQRFPNVGLFPYLHDLFCTCVPPKMLFIAFSSN